MATQQRPPDDGDPWADTAPSSPIVFLEVTHLRQPLGRIEIELFADVVPRTAENFRVLCTGERGDAELHYKGCPIHRIVRGFVVQSGDTTRGDGRGGRSIYGRSFRDENFVVKHTCAGLLSMANAGPHTNASQFFITLKPCPHLDRKHVAFGRVVKGMQVVRKIEGLRVGNQDKPVERIFISDCGQLRAGAAVPPEEEDEEEDEEAKARRLQQEKEREAAEKVAQREAAQKAAAAEIKRAQEAVARSVALGLAKQAQKRNAAREADAPTKRRRGGGMMDVFGLDSEDESDGEGND